MKKVCIVSGPKSQGARALVDELKAMGVDAIRAQGKVEGRLNIGWGAPGDVNKSLPANKLRELERCKAAGVQTVPFGGPEDCLKADLMMGRQLKHTEGKDIILYRKALNKLAWEPFYKGPKAGPPAFYTAVVPKAAEYRVHVWFGKAVRSGTKIQNDNAVKHHDLIWNLRNGWRISYGHPAPDGAKILAKGACKALGLDFCAVDVLEGKDGKWYFLEANTKPGIEGNSVLKYAEKIKLLAEEGV